MFFVPILKCKGTIFCMKKDLLTLLILATITLIIPTVVLVVKAESLSIANYLVIQDKTVKDGDIITTVEKGYALASFSYDNKLIGVVSENPSIVFGIKDATSNKYAVVNTGDVAVNVNTTNGPIKKGDAITSSSKKGVGIKATKSGYIVGIAQEDYASTNTNQIKKIWPTTPLLIA